MTRQTAAEAVRLVIYLRSHLGMFISRRTKARIDRLLAQVRRT